MFTKETDQFKFSIEFQQSGGNWHDNETFYINCYIYSEEFADIVGSTFYQYMKRIEGITKSSYSRFDITTTTNIKKLEKTILNDIEKVMVFFNSIINMEAFIKIVNNNDLLLKYYLIKHRYNDVENFLVNENKKFGMEDRWKLMKKNLKEVCAEYGYISTTLRDDL